MANRKRALVIIAGIAAFVATLALIYWQEYGALSEPLRIDVVVEESAVAVDVHSIVLIEQDPQPKWLRAGRRMADRIATVAFIALGLFILTLIILAAVGRNGKSSQLASSLIEGATGVSLSFIQEELAAFRKERREAHEAEQRRWEADLAERQTEREAKQQRWEADHQFLESLLRQRGLLHPDDQAS